MSNPTEKWKYHPLGVALEPETIKIVQVLAAEEGKTRSEMIRVLVHEALDARMLRAKGKKHG